MKAALAIALCSTAAYADISVPRDRRTCAGLPAPASDVVSERELDRGIHCRGDHCDVARRLLDRVLANPGQLATSARIVPSLTDGRSNGFKLYAVRPPSILARLLIRNGDTIQTINGMDLSSPDRALEAYSRLRAADHLAVAIERRGQHLTLDYSIR